MRKLILFILLSLASLSLKGYDNESYEVSYLEPEMIVETKCENILIECVEEPEEYETDNIQEEDILKIIETEYIAKIEEFYTTEDKLQWFIEYKELLERYKDIISLPITIYDVFSSEDIYLMQRTVETEVYQQGFIPKVNVASVIINRIENGDFGDSINEIITSPGQFAYFRTEIDETSVLALEYAYMIEDPTNGCIAFRSDKKPLVWCGWDYAFTDEAGHNFYERKKDE